MLSGVLEGSSVRQWIPCPAQLWEEGVGRKQGEVHTPGLWEGKCRKADGALDSSLPALQSGGGGQGRAGQDPWPSLVVVVMQREGWQRVLG